MNATTTTSVDPAAPTVGGYRLAERLGEGGMGEVFRAIDTMLEREVALKVLRPEMGARAELVERFRVEAIALARLHHRHIAAVYSFFQQRGQHFIAMQYVRGRTLEAVLQQRGELPWREAAAVAIDVLQALTHAHALGVVHRDLKPANLMIDHESRTVVMDFGIARVLARGRQTRAGTLVGTLEYIAPEIVRGEAADARSDLYSLGCVLYEMVTGALPFESPSDFALMRAHADQAPPRPVVRDGELPAALESIILRALEKQPSRRFANASEFLGALNAALAAATTPLRAPRPRRSVGAFRRQVAQAGEHGVAAIRWLGLPAQGGWPAWRAWARLNMGLTTAAGVAATALVLALAMGTHKLCCNVRPVELSAEWDHPAPPSLPAGFMEAAEIVRPESAPQSMPESTSESTSTPAPTPVVPPIVVAEPRSPGSTNDAPPSSPSRGVRLTGGDAKAPPSLIAPPRPAPQGWYVKR